MYSFKDYILEAHADWIMAKVKDIPVGSKVINDDELEKSDLINDARTKISTFSQSHKNYVGHSIEVKPLDASRFDDNIYPHIKVLNNWYKDIDNHIWHKSWLELPAKEYGELDL